MPAGRLRRLGTRLLGVLGALAALAAVAALWLTLRNPRVPLAPPRVCARAATGPWRTVLLGGDFAPADAALPWIAARGYRYPYEATADLVRQADLFVANLEAPVTTRTARFPLYKDYFYRVEPAATAAWRWLGLHAVNLANNHMGDYRVAGLLDTLGHLDAAGIEHVGAGPNEAAARRPVIFDLGGTRVGLLGYLEHRAAYNLYLRLFAIGGRPGCAQLNRADVIEDVRRLRPLVDIVIVSVHWGENYAAITRTQEEYARLLSELGVDVVMGHHPHDVQAVEVRGRTVVLYSLGNYAWGAPGHRELRVGLLARLRIAPRQGERAGRLAAVELLPIVTQNEIVRFQPRPLRPEERGWLGPLLQASRARGTRITEQDGLLALSLP